MTATGARRIHRTGNNSGENQGTMNKHRIGALVAAATLTLTFAGTAFANDLHQDPPIVGTEFDNTEIGCDEGWHFVHTGTDGSDLPATLTAWFKDAGKVEVAGYSNGGGNAIVMYDVHVSPSDTLEGASDSISDEGKLNLSHVCVDETTTTTTTDETTTTDVETTTDETTTTTTDVETTTTDVETTTTDVETTTTDVETTTTDSTETETTDTTTTTNSTTPEGSVEELTPPSTDTLGQPASSSTVSTGLLLVLAGVLAGVLVLTPAVARRRR